MLKRFIIFLTIAGSSVWSVRAEAAPDRPAIESAKPIAACKLHVMAPSRPPMVESPVVLQYGMPSPADDPLANYERTPLGNWQMPARGERGDPWLRLLLLAPKRPYVLDIAVLIDGKSFRGSREDWIGGILAQTKSAATKSDRTAPAKEEPSDSKGTNSAEQSTKVTPAANSQPADAAVPAKLPGVAAQTRNAPTMRERLIRYLAANGDVGNRDEIDWLIAESGYGPALVVLAPSLSWQRAGEAPLWSLLDQDSDGVLSANEISQRDARFAKADNDSNEVVDLSEIRRLAKPANLTLPAEGHALVVPLDANTDWDSLAANVGRIYRADKGRGDSNATSSTVIERVSRGDSSLDGKQLQELTNSPADITLSIGFAAKGSSENKDNSSTGVSLLSISPELTAANKSVTATADVMSLDLAGDVLEISAAQGAGADSPDTNAAQLAVGAVIDGFPLLRLIDRDQDGRLTLRERQELGGLLAALDRNGDKQLSSSEVPTPIRLAVSLGPQIHELLKDPAGAARLISPRETAKAPDWFVSMDKNNDGDLARSEFLGTAEQFRKFDADQDGLLSIPEALKVNSGL